MGIEFKVTGDWKKTEKALKAMQKQDFWGLLHKYGQRGVVALSNATPADSGATAASWSYELYHKGPNEATELVWYNSNNQGGASVAVLIQYGHGTRTGGYVQGRDYINPALRPILDAMAEELWATIKKL